MRRRFGFIWKRGLPCVSGGRGSQGARRLAPDETRVDRHFLAPGKPIQTAFAESSNGRLRDEL